MRNLSVKGFKVTVTFSGENCFYTVATDKVQSHCLRFLLYAQKTSCQVSYHYAQTVDFRKGDT